MALIDKETAVRALIDYRQGHDTGEYWRGVADSITILDGLPEAQPEPSTGDCVSREAVLKLFATHDGNYLYEAIRDMPAVEPEKRTEERTETHACDLISRQAAIEKFRCTDPDGTFCYCSSVMQTLRELPSAQPEPESFEWCHDCAEYDQTAHCCHRWTKVIRDTVEEMRQEKKVGEWMRYGEDGSQNDQDTVYWQCDQCLNTETGRREMPMKFCPNCGAYMNGGLKK